MVVVQIHAVAIAVAIAIAVDWNSHTSIDWDFRFDLTAERYPAGLHSKLQFG